MKRLTPTLIALSLIIPSVQAEDDLPEVRSLLPEPVTANEPKPSYMPKRRYEPVETYGYESQRSNDSQRSYEPDIGQSDQFDNSDQYAADEMPESTDSTQKMLMQWFKRVHALQNQVQELTGKLEEQEYKLSALEARHEQEILGLKNLAGKLGDTGNKSSEQLEKRIEADDSIISKFEFSPEPAAPTRTEGEIYQGAYKALQAKNYGLAKSEFLKLIEAHPNGQFSANAHYWLGEIYLIQDNYEQAEQAFKTVSEKFSTHAKAGDALLKLGFVAMQQEQWQAAKGYFEQVKSKFPNTVAARLAENRLQQLKNQGV